MAKQNFSGYLRTLRLLFFTLFAGQIIFTVVLYLLFPAPSTPESGNELLLYGLPVLMTGGVLATFFIRRQQAEKARLLSELSQRLDVYRRMCLMRWGISEGVTFCSLATYFFLLCHPVLLALSLLGIAFFGTLFPSRHDIIAVLDLSAAEQARLDDPLEKVADNLE